VRARLALILATLAVGLSFSAVAQQSATSAPQEPSKPEIQQAPASEKPAVQTETILAEKPITQELLRELIRRAILNEQENYKDQRNLTHIEREQTEHLDSKDNIKKTEIITREVFVLYGERVEHVLEKNDKPLTGDDARKEQEKFDKEVQKLKDESPDKRRKRQEKFEKDTKEDREFIDDGMNAFDFTLVGEEMVNGRPAYVIQGEPRKDYKPKVKHGDILKKLRGKVWIDIASTSWVKLDVEFTDTVSFGWFLARVRPGTRVQAEQVLFRDELWVPREVNFKLDARVALLKQYFANVNVKFRDWRKFSTDSKISGFAEMEPKRETKPAETPAPAPPQ